MKTCFTESATAHSVKPNSFYESIHEKFDGNKIDILHGKKELASMDGEVNIMLP